MIPTDPRRWRKPQRVRWIIERLMTDLTVTSGELYDELNTLIGRPIARSTFRDYLAEARVETAKLRRPLLDGLAEELAVKWEILWKASVLSGDLRLARAILRDVAKYTGVFDRATDGGLEAEAVRVIGEFVAVGADMPLSDRQAEAERLVRDRRDQEQEGKDAEGQEEG